MVVVLLMPVAVGADDSILGAPAGQWQRETTKRIEFNYTNTKRDTIAPQIELYKQFADSTFDMMTDIFGVNIPQPVPIYLFTDAAQYTQLVPNAKDNTMLFSSIDRNGVYILVPRMSGLKAPELQQDLRRLFAREMVTEASGGNLPKGLADGISRYAEAPPGDLPALVAALNQQAASDRLTPWGTLLNSTDAAATAQNYSVVAFLIDGYGFRATRAFIQSLSTKKDWRAAMQDTFKETPAVLESKWKGYVPQFIHDRWQQNQFTLYDTSDAVAAINTGQYTQAVTLLQPAIPFLQQIANTKKASDAQSLLSKARAGSEAETVMRDAQQALEGNDYQRTLQLIGQANELYKGVPDAKPPLLLFQYRDRAERGVRATDELTSAEQAVTGWNVLLARQRAGNALATFNEHGNAPLIDRAQAVVDRANREMRLAGLGTVGTGLLVLLLGLTLTSIRRGRRLTALPPLE